MLRSLLKSLLSFALLIGLSTISPAAFGETHLLKIEEGELSKEEWVEAVSALSQPALRSKIEKAISARKSFPRKQLVSLLSHPQLIVRIGALELLEDAAADDFQFNPWSEPGKNDDNQLSINRWNQWAGSKTNIQKKTAKIAPEQMSLYIQQILSDDRQRSERAVRMLENNNFHAVSTIQTFILEHPELPLAKRAQLKKAQYQLVLIKSSRTQAAALARDLVHGKRDQQLNALAALKTLGRVTIPIIRDFVSSTDGLIRETAVDSLLTVGGAQALPTIVEQLKSETDVNVLHVAIRNIKNIGGEDAIEIISQLLDHSDEDIVVAAIHSVTKLSGGASSSTIFSSAPAARSLSPTSQKAVNKVLNLLEDPRWRVRDAAVIHVTKTKNKAAIPTIVNLLANDTDDFVRSHCIEAAVALNSQEALPLLEKMFLNDDSQIGTLTPAIKSLSGRLPENLLKHLQSRDPDTIISSLKAFRGDKKHNLNILAGFATHPNLDVSCAALRILANDEDKLKHAFVADTLSDALDSGELDKIQAVLNNLDLPRLGRMDPRLAQISASVEPEGGPTALDPLYNAFLRPGGKALMPMAVTVTTKSSGGVANLVKSIAQFADSSDYKDLHFQISLLLNKAGDPRGLLMLKADINELPMSQRNSLAESLYQPSIQEAIAVFDILLQDPSKDIRKEASENAFSNERNIALIKQALTHLTKADTKLKPVDIYTYQFENATRQSHASTTIRRWAIDALKDSSIQDEVHILALTSLRHNYSNSLLETILPYIESPNPWVRRAAWHTLALNQSSHVKAHVDQLVGDQSSHVTAVLAEVTNRGSTEWQFHFNDLEFRDDSSYYSSRNSRRLTDALEAGLQQIATSDPSPRNRFEASFSLLSHSRTIDLESFISLIGKQPKEARAVRRLSDYVESNYSKMGKGLKPLLAYIDFKRIDKKHHAPIFAHFNTGKSDNGSASFNTFDELAEVTDMSKADQQHLSTPEEQDQTAIQRDQLVVILFEKEGCKQCAKAHEVLKSLKPDFPLMELQIRSMSDNQGILLNDHLSHKLSLPSNAIGKTPSIFTSAGYLSPPITPQKLGALLEKTMSSPVEAGWYQLETPEALAAAEKRVDERYDSLTLPIVIAGGLLDGINPCAFATIIFFISYLGVAKRTPKEIFLVGSAFILAVFLSYLSVGLLFSSVISKLTENSGYLWLKNALNYVFAGFALLVSVLSLRDYFRARRGRLDEMTLQLPEFLKKRIKGVIRKGAKSRRFIIAAFTSGIAISFLELACTGQVYAPIIYKINQGESNATYMLIIYNLAFILPLVVIFALAMGGMKSNALIAFQQKHTSTVRLLTAILFFLLATVLIFSDFFSGLMKGFQPMVSLL